MAKPDLTKMTRTEFQLAMMDDSASHWGWTTHIETIMGDPARHYHKDDRSVYVSMYPTAGVATVRILTFEGVWFTPNTDKISEIMAELCATENATEWKL